MKGICFLCGNWEELEEHHIFTGALRPLSTKYKATVRLCPWCHRLDGDAVHKSRATREYIQDYGQRLVMAKQGLDGGRVPGSIREELPPARDRGRGRYGQRLLRADR